MFFCQEHRSEVSAELGTGATNMIQKELGTRWAATEDRSRYDHMAGKDRARHDREMAGYDAELAREEAEEQAMRDAKASGPSDREVERSEKRAAMQEKATARMDAPKAPKKQKVLTDEQKHLAEQNKVIEADKDRAAKNRLKFLLGQSDLRAVRDRAAPPSPPCLRSCPRACAFGLPEVVRTAETRRSLREACQKACQKRVKACRGLPQRAAAPPRPIWHAFHTFRRALTRSGTLHGLLWVVVVGVWPIGGCG
eukprot:7375958-Prymnesium_polylepis.2